EYPVSGGLSSNVYRPEDGANYVELVKEVRRQLEVAGATDSRHYLLTIAAPAGYDKYNNFQLAAMSPSLDWFNVMTYDYHGTWENQTNHQAALFANPNDPSGVGAQYNVDFTIQAYMDAGVPTGKIVMGAPIYGRGWSGVANVNNGLFQNATGSASGTWEKGVFDYSDLLNKVKTQPEVYKVYWDTQADTPFIYAPTVEGGMFSTFENPEMIAKRVDYIFANQLGGMMFWEASGDVRDSNSPDSLIGTAAKLLNGVGV
ncbi:MAG: glycoside hydrolase family 18 protein, partial [Planctomycetia bacterium]